jgi:hypothetical protein
MMVLEYGLRWHQFMGPARMRLKEKFFADEDKRAAFARRLAEREDFVEFLAWLDPVVTIH